MTTSGKSLELRVGLLCEGLDLKTSEQFHMGRRLWGAKRFVDLLVSDKNHLRVGLECKFQGTSGSAEEKLLATLDDIKVWPIRGLIVIDGDGFSAAMAQYVIGTGRAVLFEDLEIWLRLFFQMEIL